MHIIPGSKSKKGRRDDIKTQIKLNMIRALNHHQSERGTLELEVTNSNNADFDKAFINHEKVMCSITSTANRRKQLMNVNLAMTFKSY